MKNLFKKIPLKIYILGILLVEIYFLRTDVQILKDEYDRFYVYNGIGGTIVEELLFITPWDDSSFLPNEKYYYGQRKEVAIGDTPFETRKMNHYIIGSASDVYYYIEGLKSQCLFDLPLLRTSMKEDVKNTVLLCDMMQRCIIDYSPENLGNTEDLKNMTRLMKEFLFIWYDTGGTYVPDINLIGDESHSTKGNYDFLSHEPSYTLNDIESNFKRFNTFLEGDGAELFQNLLEKYSPKS